MMLNQPHWSPEWDFLNNRPFLKFSSGPSHKPAEVGLADKCCGDRVAIKTVGPCWCCCGTGCRSSPQDVGQYWEGKRRQ